MAELWQAPPTAERIAENRGLHFWELKAKLEADLREALSATPPATAIRVRLIFEDDPWFLNNATIYLLVEGLEGQEAAVKTALKTAHVMDWTDFKADIRDPHRLHFTLRNPMVEKGQGTYGKQFMAPSQSMRTARNGAHAPARGAPQDQAPLNSLLRITLLFAGGDDGYARMKLFDGPVHPSWLGRDRSCAASFCDGTRTKPAVCGRCARDGSPRCRVLAGVKKSFKRISSAFETSTFFATSLPPTCRATRGQPAKPG